MKRALAIATVFATVGLGRDARATAGTAFSETSRSASLADAVSARPGDAGTILSNPAGLGDLKEAMVLFGSHADYVAQWFRPVGDNASQDRRRGFGGFSFAAATPLPGPAWARNIGAGFALDLPAQYLLHIDVPTRIDQPTSPIYDGRPDRIAAVFALGFRIFPRIEIGAGFALSPSLSLPTNVKYVAGRSPNVNDDPGKSPTGDNVEVRIDSSLDLSAAPFFGLRAQPFDWLAVSLVYRDTQASRATGTQTTVAGGIVASDPIDFFEMWDPATVVVGACAWPTRNVSVSLDVTWRKWSDFRTAFDQVLIPPYQLNDTVSIASGIEARRGPWAVRGGIGFEPSPIPAQTGDTNYLGGNTLVLALGGGIDLRRHKWSLPVVIDAHVRARIDAAESARKNPSALSDADSTLPGTQIDNMGFPGFRSQALMIQAGLTATFFLGGGK